VKEWIAPPPWKLLPPSNTAFVGNYLEWTGATNTMKKYYYAGATRVAMREGSSSVYYLLGDHLGSTSVVTDPGGAILSATRYDPWGELRAVSGPSQTSYGYTGQRAEKGLGLYFYGARFYDPQLSRFLSADSIIPQQQGGAGLGPVRLCFQQSAQVHRSERASSV